MQIQNRLIWLDYLRGLCAIGIMLHHYLSWLTNTQSIKYSMKVGLYGVSIFYVLSGLTLYHVYKDKLKFTSFSLSSFYLKRIFRLFPLLWITTFLAIILKGNKEYVDWILNFTGLFGFIKWDAGIAPGVWSIGNELVFYAFFPIILFLTRKNISLLIVTGVLILSIYMYFAFKIIPVSNNLKWVDYVNPFNQLFLFYGGIAIGYFFDKVNMKNIYWVLLLITSITIFILYPVTGDRIAFVSYNNRIIFTALCFSICLSCYKITYKLPKIIEYPLTKFGEATYSIYLLHPIIWISLGYIITNLYLKFILSIFFTIIIGLLSYYKFERLFINSGSYLISKVFKSSQKEN